MSIESSSKYIEFIIEDCEVLSDIMEESGYIVGRGTVSSYWDDSMINDDVDSTIALQWVNDLGEDKVLTGEEYDLVYDEIFDSIRIADLLLMEEGYETDLSDYKDKSVKEMLNAKDRTIRECRNCTAFNGCVCFTVFKGVSNEYVNATFYCKAFEIRVRKGDN